MQTCNYCQATCLTCAHLKVKACNNVLWKVVKRNSWQMRIESRYKEGCYVFELPGHSSAQMYILRPRIFIYHSAAEHVTCGGQDFGLLKECVRVYWIRCDYSQHKRKLADKGECKRQTDHTAVFPLPGTKPRHELSSEGFFVLAYSVFQISRSSSQHSGYLISSEQIGGNEIAGGYRDTWFFKWIAFYFVRSVHWCQHLLHIVNTYTFTSTLCN